MMILATLKSPHILTNARLSALFHTINTFKIIGRKRSNAELVPPICAPASWAVAVADPRVSGSSLAGHKWGPMPPRAHDRHLTWKPQRAAGTSRTGNSSVAGRLHRPCVPPSRRGVRTAARGNRPAHVLYDFAHDIAPPAHGVPHTAEIPFVFGTYADLFFAAKAGTGPSEGAISHAMLRAWAQSAQKGTPGPRWTAATAVALPGNVLGGPEGAVTVRPHERTEGMAISAMT